MDEETFKGHLDFVKEMTNDINRCVKHLNELTDKTDPNLQFWGRMYVRAYATWIEGTMWIYKKMIWSLYLDKAIVLDTAQQLYFTETDWSFSSTCEIEISEKKLSTINNFKCLLKQMAKIEGSIKVDLGGAEWASIKEFFVIRDRITHPSDPAHMSLSDAEIIQSDMGRKWVTKIVIQFNREIMKRLGSNGGHEKQESPV